MGVSKILRMPDLGMLEIPEKQRNIHVRDEQIFRELKLRLRRLEDRTDGAQPGDFVRVEVTRPNGTTRTVQVELGGKAFPEYGAALEGCRTGQTVALPVHGETLSLRVLAARQVIQPDVTDETVAALGIPGISTMADYRQKFLRDHTEELANKLFGALKAKLCRDVLELTEFSLDADEVDLYHRRQRQMLQNISGDINERLLRAYGDGGKNSLEECDRLYCEDNRRNFSFQLWGKTLAEQDKTAPSEEEYAKALEFYCLAFNTTAEQVSADSLENEVCRSFYMQYAMGHLRDHFLSILNISAEQIPAIPLKSGLLDTKVGR